MRVHIYRDDPMRYGFEDREQLLENGNDLDYIEPLMESGIDVDDETFARWLKVSQAYADMQGELRELYRKQP